MKFLAGKSTIFDVFLFLPTYLSCCRCLDGIFLTWNESTETLHGLLHVLNRHYPDIRLTIIIHNSVNYLDVNISHIDGELKTRVVHDFNVESYALPYVVGHRQHEYSTLPQAALLRATRCYVNVSDFADEVRNIQTAFQHNRFGHEFFIRKYQSFLEEFEATPLENLAYGAVDHDQSLYDYLRQGVINDNQLKRKAKNRRCQRQTVAYRWKDWHNDDI